MGRPRLYDQPRVTTAVRLPIELRDRLRHHAQLRDVSVNHLVNRAIEDLLDHLDELGPAVGRRPDGGVTK